MPLHIIKLSEDKLGIEDSEIEVEYQSDTIGKYDLAFDGKSFILKNKKTACLAQDSCGVPSEKQKIIISETIGNTSCSPNGSCC